MPEVAGNAGSTSCLDSRARTSATQRRASLWPWAKNSGQRPGRAIRAAERWPATIGSANSQALNRHGGSLTVVDRAQQIAWRQAITDQTNLDAGLSQRFGQCVIGNARRGPNEQADVGDAPQPSSEDIAPRQHIVLQRGRLGRHDDRGIGLIEPAVDTNGAAVVHVAGNLRARGEDYQLVIAIG